MKKLLVFLSALLAVNAAPQQGYVLSGPQGSFDTRSGGGPAFGEAVSQQHQQQQFSPTGSSLPATSQPDISGQFQAGASSQLSGSSFSRQGQFQAGASSHQSAGGSYSGQTDQSFPVSNEQSFTGQVAQVSTAGAYQPSSNIQLSQTPSQQIEPSPQFQPSQHTVTSGQFQSTGLQENFVRGSSQGVSRAVGSEGGCPDGQTRHVDGRCVTPEVMRHVFVYAAPDIPHSGNVDKANIPLPKVEHNIVFIRTDELNSRNDPIIIPPPQKKHIIYVLNKESQFGGQKVIQVTTPKPKQPEVYFVNYAEGQTPTLPDGTDFETALKSAVQAESQVIDGSKGFDGHNEQTTNIVSNVGASVFSSEVSSGGFDANIVTGSSSSDRRSNYNNQFTVNSGSPPRFGKGISNAVSNTNSDIAPTEDIKSNIQDQDFSANAEGTSEFNNEVIDVGFDTTRASSSSSNIRGNINNQEFAVNVQSSAIGVPLPASNEYGVNTADSLVQENLPSNDFGVVVSDSISVSPDPGSNTLRSGSTNTNDLRVKNSGSSANNAVPDNSLYGRNQGRGNAVATFTANIGSEATFSNSNLGTEGTFSNSNLGSEATFSNSNLGSEATFSNSNLGSEGPVSNNNFGSESTSSNNNFGSEAPISNNNFGSEGTFFNSNFGSATTNSKNNFGSEAPIYNNNFGSEGTFSNSNFGSEATFSNNFASASVITSGVQDNISNFNAVRPPVSATVSNNFDSHSAGPLASSSGALRETTVSANSFQASSVREDVPQTAYSAP
ncbi:putative uncharacterized protein DDB_G0282133 [Macrobrachium nipponense]|uniref:putative uncharacterized protein DDB_G0282133 n=1 Tax=Macrobrachium nipponense TaxID=159736 RepID=UPI0030C889F5